MAADVEAVQRLLLELHRVKDEGFPDSEVLTPADDTLKQRFVPIHKKAGSHMH